MEERYFINLTKVDTDSTTSDIDYFLLNTKYGTTNTTQYFLTGSCTTGSHTTPLTQSTIPNNVYSDPVKPPNNIQYKGVEFEEKEFDLCNDNKIKICLPKEIFEEIRKRIKTKDTDVLKSLDRLIKELSNWPNSALENEW